ncbi:hypothetical protein ACKC9G_13270 [Pokkaliibacter sp. CJK22405]|uniref:hypothetical protein n=1 Tax=Pokkaliibacter sp. CJK22405 TaxID=3384615 RepID=UPI003984F9A9
MSLRIVTPVMVVFNGCLFAIVPQLAAVLAIVTLFLVILCFPGKSFVSGFGVTHSYNPNAFSGPEAFSITDVASSFSDAGSGFSDGGSSICDGGSSFDSGGSCDVGGGSFD